MNAGMTAKVNLSCSSGCFTLEIAVTHDERNELDVLRELLRDDLGECEKCKTPVTPTFQRTDNYLNRP